MQALDTNNTDYKVKDINLAGWGRKEIEIAEDRNAGTDGTAHQVQGGTAAEGCATSWAAST